MSVTNIEWADRVWNPVTGCTKVSQGCKNCYAEGVANRFFAYQYPQVAVGPTLPDGGPAAWRPRQFTDVQTHDDRLIEPLSWRKPARVFVNSMSDLFHEDVPDQFIVDVFGVMALAHWHSFLVLTKRPERMRAFLAAGDHGIVGQFQAIEANGGIGPEGLFKALDIKRRDGVRWSWPLPNVWLGVSVEDQATADDRIPLLLQTPAAIRFVSYEPALERVSLRTIVVPDDKAGKWAGHGMTFNALQREDDLTLFNAPAHLDWVIVGGESGPGARPFDIAWARSVVAQCRDAGTPVFVKQLGSKPLEQFARRPEDPRSVEGWTPARRNATDGADIWFRYLPLASRKGGDMAEWPVDLRRREFPASGADGR